EKLLKARRMLLFFFQANMAIDVDKVTQFCSRHFVIALLRRAIGALDSMHRYTAGPQHAFYFCQHRVFFVSFDMAHYIEADDVVEARISEWQTGEARTKSRIVSIAQRCRSAFSRKIDAGQRYALAFQQGEHARTATEVEQVRLRAHVIENPHGPREANVEAIDCFEVAGV